MKSKTAVALLISALITTSVVSTAVFANPPGQGQGNHKCQCMKKKRPPMKRKQNMQAVKPGNKPNPLQFNPHGWDG